MALTALPNDRTVDRDVTALYRRVQLSPTTMTDVMFSLPKGCWITRIIMRVVTAATHATSSTGAIQVVRSGPTTTVLSSGINLKVTNVLSGYDGFAGDPGLTDQVDTQIQVSSVDVGSGVGAVIEMIVHATRIDFTP